MSAPRRRQPSRDVRAELLVSARAKCARWPDRIELGDGTVVVSPWPRLLARLEAGEAVEVPAHLVPLWARPDGDASGRVVVEVDGSVRVL